MANLKNIVQLLREYGVEVYCVIRRDSDGYWLDDSNGVFALNPVDKHVTLTENPVTKGLYELNETRTIWNDGLYIIAIYQQLGATPDSTTDKMVGGGEMWISNDREVSAEAAEVTPRVTTTIQGGLTLSNLIEMIQEILQDDYYTPTMTARINRAVNVIAGGLRMPNGIISPPLPDLYKFTNVTTLTDRAYVPLPTDYMRKVFRIYDKSGYAIAPPPGGDYYAFTLFLRYISNMELNETGSIYRVAIRGTNVFYQGIPTVAENLGVHYYRKPYDMALEGDNPDGIPIHLQERLIKHYVLKEIYGSQIEDGQDNVGISTKYHSSEFMLAMIDLCDYIGIDAEPEYYGGAGNFQDLGACDG
jgi:hypothetical protein